MLYRRIFSLRVRWFRIGWWINTIVAILNGLVLLVFGLTACTPHPPSYAWHHLGSCREGPASIAPMGVVNAATDFAILLLPIRMCWSLQLSRKRKLGLFIVLGLGLMYVFHNREQLSTRAETDPSSEPLQSVWPVLWLSPLAALPEVCNIKCLSLLCLQKIRLEGWLAFPDGVGGLNFVIWSTTEPAVALICACLPITRNILASSISKISSCNRNGWLCFGRSKSTDTESTRNLSLSASNHQLKGFGSSPISTPFSQHASQKEYLFGSGSTREGSEKPGSTQQHARTRDSTFSEIYPMADIYRQAETPKRETHLNPDKGSASSDSGFDAKSWANIIFPWMFCRYEMMYMMLHGGIKALGPDIVIP